MAHVEAFSRGPRTRAAQVQPETFIWRIRRPMAMPGWDAVSVERLKSNKTSKGLDEKGRRSFSAAIWTTNLAAKRAHSSLLQSPEKFASAHNSKPDDTLGWRRRERSSNGDLRMRPFTSAILERSKPNASARGLNYLFKTGSNDSGRSRLATFASEGTRSKK